jgi:DUF218 domain
MLKSIYEWLVSADPPANADVIFVLAGLPSRKMYAANLFQRGIAPRVLFSVGRFEIRRFSELGLPQTPDLLQMAQKIPPQHRHFFVLLEGQKFEVHRIPIRTLGTLSEIDALADWLKERPQNSSLIVVSSGTHLRRLRMCCRALLPQELKIRLRAVPEENPASNREKWWIDAPTRKLVLSELIKILCYAAFMPFWRIARRWRSKTITSLAP